MHHQALDMLDFTLIPKAQNQQVKSFLTNMRATVAQQDNARHLLTWTPDSSQGVPLRVQLRSEGGAGPLEVLKLRHFALPARIFVAGGAKAGPRVGAGGPPPLPQAALAAAKQAVMSLPQGSVPEVE